MRLIDADVAPVVHSYWKGYSCSQYMGIDESESLREMLEIA